MEKTAIKAKNHERKVAYADALSHVQDIVMQEAIKLQEQFGSRTIEYYFKAILQTSHLTKKKGTEPVERVPSTRNKKAQQQ